MNKKNPAILLGILALFVVLALIAFFFAGWRYALLLLAMAFPITQFIAMQQGNGGCCAHSNNSETKEQVNKNA